MTRIELDGLAKAYGPQQVLAGLTLAAEPGELLALLGPSGSGKSTILKLIAGIEEPDGGAILLGGADVAGLPAHRRGAVLMFQSAHLFPFLNVADNIGFGLKLRGVARRERAAEVARMLELVELPGIERKYPRQLSGGQAQRVALARALVVRPRVLLLDEPLSNLDPHIRQALQETIRRVQRELAVTTLLVTHDLGEAVALADRIALLLGGRIEALGPPAALFNRPPTEAAARFVGVSAFLRGELRDGALATAAGSIAVGPGLAAGPPRLATLAIRPERIGLAPSPRPGGLPARILQAVYRGDHTEYAVELAGLRFRLRADSQAIPGPALAPGDQAFVSFPAEHLFEVAAPPAD